MECPTEKTLLKYTLSGGYQVDFTAYAPFHTFKGWTTKGLEAEIEIDPETFTIVRARAQARTDCFDTGYKDRNRAMMAYMKPENFPLAKIEMTECKDVTQLDETRFTASVLVVLEFMGQRRQFPLSLSITMTPSGFSVSLDFKWSFKAYGLKAPSLLFLTVRDIVDISGKGDFVQIQE